ncbi:helix-turn-helix domain-containing protein [Oceanobacter mangrovi]|uniref:helix-turn-helix domain-containing protein n=1 Tax=Oceanobacter mangrovi TaxID=2862510 RepID=UPI001FE50DE9|nr:helix-turn-helix domain-containing protein [Oceanobacter mangrovi]
MHASNLTNWQQQYDQVSAGEFHGQIIELPFDNLQVFREDTSQALQQKCVVWPDSVWLGIPLAQQPDCRINGLAVGDGALMCQPGSHDFQLSTPEQYQLYGMVVQRDALQALAVIHGVEISDRLAQGPGRRAIPQQTLDDARYILARLLNQQDPRGRNRMSRDVLMMTVLELLKEEQPQPCATPSYQHRKQVVDQVCALIDSQPDQPFTVTDLCESANVSRRTLQYSFQSILGISPIKYLRVSRLNGVRRALVRAAARSGGMAVSQTSIADIASQWGFWHMSQFAKDYRTQFGELPSETLQQRSLQ